MSCPPSICRIPPRALRRPFSPRPWIVPWAGLCIALSTSQSLSAACPNLAPSFNITAHVQVVANGGGFFPREANLAVNTDLPEVLFTFLGTSDVPHTDPITGQPAFWGLFGVFYDPLTVQPKGPPFLIETTDAGMRGTIPKDEVFESSENTGRVRLAMARP